MGKKLVFKDGQVIEGKITARIGKIAEIALATGGVMMVEATDVTEIEEPAEEPDPSDTNKDSVKEPEIAPDKPKRTRRTTKK